MNQSTKEIALYFFRLGLFGFGGPLALVSMMQKDLVQDRKWISETEFQQVLALIKSMPGTLAFQLGVYIGYRCGGLRGATLAAIGLVTPALVMMIFLGYVLGQENIPPVVRAILGDLQVAALVLICLGLWNLAKPFRHDFVFLVLAVLCAFIFYYQWLPEPVIVIGLGILWVLKDKISVKAVPSLFFPPLVAQDLWEGFTVSLKAGTFVFGSGLAIVPFLHSDFVERLGWVSNNDFMQALMLGQITPGPVVITVAAIGFQKMGVVGAIITTFGVFIPSFFHMTTWFPRTVNYLSKQRWIKSFTFGAFAAVVGTIAVILAQYLVVSMTSWQPVATFIFLLAASFIWKWGSFRVIGVGLGLSLFFRLVF